MWKVIMVREDRAKTDDGIMICEFEKKASAEHYAETATPDDGYFFEVSN